MTMVKSCAIYKCTNRAGRDSVSFYRLPAVSKQGSSMRIRWRALRRKKWLLAIRRQDVTERYYNYLAICSDHFVTGKPANLKDRDHPDWVPCIRMGYGNTSDPNYIQYKESQVPRQEKSKTKRRAQNINFGGPLLVDEDILRTVDNIIAEIPQVFVDMNDSQESDGVYDSTDDSQESDGADYSIDNIHHTDEIVGNMNDTQVKNSTGDLTDDQQVSVIDSQESIGIDDGTDSDHLADKIANNMNGSLGTAGSITSLNDSKDQDNDMLADMSGETADNGMDISFLANLTKLHCKRRSVDVQTEISTTDAHKMLEQVKEQANLTKLRQKRRSVGVQTEIATAEAHKMLEQVNKKFKKADEVLKILIPLCETMSVLIEPLEDRLNSSNYRYEYCKRLQECKDQLKMLNKGFKNGQKKMKSFKKKLNSQFS